MTAEHFQAPDAPGFKLDPPRRRRFRPLRRRLLAGRHRRSAWLLTLALAAFLILSTGATVALNHWNRWFFDSLEARDVESITQAVLVFALIIAAMAAIGVGIVLTRETLQVRWRAWLVEHLVDRWLGKPALLSPQRHRQGAAQPRVPHLRRHALGHRAAGRPRHRPAAGRGRRRRLHQHPVDGRRLDHLRSRLRRPASPSPPTWCWVALAYGVIASGLMLWVGAPLVGYVGRKNEAEGYFRFGMMRIRDNAESVALMNGARYEQAILGRFYETVVARWMAIVWQHGHLTWITNSSGPMIPDHPAAVRRAQVPLRRPHARPGDAARRRLRRRCRSPSPGWSTTTTASPSGTPRARRVMDIVDACDDDRRRDRRRRPARQPDARGTAVRLDRLRDRRRQPAVR